MPTQQEIEQARKLLEGSGFSVTNAGLSPRAKHGDRARKVVVGFGITNDKRTGDLIHFDDAVNFVCRMIEEHQVEVGVSHGLGLDDADDLIEHLGITDPEGIAKARAWVAELQKESASKDEKGAA